jgi:TonB family protein
MIVYRQLYLVVILMGALACNQTTSEKKNKSITDTTQLAKAENKAGSEGPQKNDPLKGLDDPSEMATPAATLDIKEGTSLADLFKQFDKKAQTFTIASDKDTTLICKEGTKITIRANSFIKETTKDQPNGKISISVKEYYKTSDMIFANLSTTSDNKLLETGGMIYVSAASNNENCILKEGKKIGIGFPFTNQKKGMQLFTGQWSGNNINWQPSINHIFDLSNVKLDLINNPIEDTIVPPALIVEQMPDFPGGRQALLSYIKANLKYPYTAIEKHLEGKVFVQFIVRPDGTLSNICIIKGVDPVLDKAAYSIVRNMPKWKPGMQNGLPVSVQFTIPINFKDGGRSLSEKETIEAKEFEEKTKDFKTIDSLYRGKLITQKDDTTVWEAYGYLFNALRLGWINCDRFYNSNKPLINFVVKINNSEESTVDLVFHSIKSIMRCDNGYNDFYFYNVPLGEAITIIAFKKVDGKILFASKETTINQAGESELDFKPVTLTQLKAEVEKLNNLN